MFVLDSEIGPHGPQDIDDARAGGINTNALDLDPGAGVSRSEHHPVRRSADIAGDGHVKSHGWRPEGAEGDKRIVGNQIQSHGLQEPFGVIP